MPVAGTRVAVEQDWRLDSPQVTNGSRWFGIPPPPSDGPVHSMSTEWYRWAEPRDRHQACGQTHPSHVAAEFLWRLARQPSDSADSRIPRLSQCFPAVGARSRSMSPACAKHELPGIEWRCANYDERARLPSA